MQGFLTSLRAVIVAPIVDAVNASARFFFGGPASADPPLIQAAARGHTEACLRLVVAGADVNARLKHGTFGQTGWTPLMVAALRGHASTCKQLIQLGAAVNANDNFGCTPLLWAARCGHADVCTLLIGNGADVHVKGGVGRTPLMYAADCGLTDVCVRLIELGAEADAEDSRGCTPLMYAAHGGHKDTCLRLCELSANVNARGTNGYTPLHYAVWLGHSDVCTLLIELGADVNARLSLPVPDDATPLLLAMDKGHVGISVALLSGRRINCTATPNARAIAHLDSAVLRLHCAAFSWSRRQAAVAARVQAGRGRSTAAIKAV